MTRLPYTLGLEPLRPFRNSSYSRLGQGDPITPASFETAESQAVIEFLKVCEESTHRARLVFEGEDRVAKADDPGRVCDQISRD